MPSESITNVPPRTPKTECARCHAPLRRGDRFVWVVIAAGVRGGALHGSDVHEVAHARCDDPQLRVATAPKNTTPRQALKPQKTIEPLRPRHEDYVCARCQRVVERGDRFQVVYLAQGIGLDPETNNPGVSCTSEYEVVHISCDDRDLSKGGGVLVINA